MGLVELQKILKRVSKFFLLLVGIAAFLDIVFLLSNGAQYNFNGLYLSLIVLAIEIISFKINLWENKTVFTITSFIEIVISSFLVVNVENIYMKSVLVLAFIVAVIRMVLIYDFTESYARRMLTILAFSFMTLLVIVKMFTSYGENYYEILGMVCLMVAIILFVTLVLECLSEAVNNAHEQLFEHRRMADVTKESNEALKMQQEKINKANELLGLQKLKLEAAYQKMHDMAIKDGLTGIYNRGYLNQVFGDLCVESVSENRTLTVALFDIDHFKLVNDTYGHLFGDAVIVAVAKIAQEMSAKHKGLAARYGGEEFVVVFPGKDIRASIGIVEEMKEKISKHQLDYNNIPVSVHVSIGVTSYPETCAEPLELLNHADWAMYYSKQNGRDRITVDSDEVRGAVKINNRE